MDFNTLVLFLKTWKMMGVLNNIDFEYENIFIAGFQTKADLMDTTYPKPCLLAKIDVDSMVCVECEVQDGEDCLFFDVSGELANKFRSLKAIDFEYQIP